MKVNKENTRVVFHLHASVQRFTGREFCPIKKAVFVNYIKIHTWLRGLGTKQKKPP